MIKLVIECENVQHAIETLQLIQDGHLSKAGLNVVLTLVFSFLAVWGGFLLGRGIHH